MCKKYLLIAMLLVGSASHSLVVSAATNSTATMKFEGDISKTCSGRVVTSGVKEILFGGASPGVEHEHQLEVSGNTLAKVDLVLSATKYIYAYTSAPAPASASAPVSTPTPTPITVDLKSKKNTETAFTGVNKFTDLKPGESINVYLHVPSYQKSKIKPGSYAYNVTATIDCS